MKYAAYLDQELEWLKIDFKHVFTHLNAKFLSGKNVILIDLRN